MSEEAALLCPAPEFLLSVRAGEYVHIIKVGRVKRIIGVVGSGHLLKNDLKYLYCTAT